MKKAFYFIFLSLLFISCKPDAHKESFSVVTWNMYLFFDSREDGYEYNGYRKSDGYNDKIYSERIDNTSLALAKNFADVDLIVLQEIESNIVLYDLLQAGLKKKGFRYYGVAKSEKSPLSVGFISKYTPDSISFHGIDNHRTQLELSFTVNGELISIVVIHATSRLADGEDERFDEFSLVRSIADLNSGSLCLIAGDFNADPRECEKGVGNIRKIVDSNTPIVCTGDPGECKDGVYFSQALDYMNHVGKGTYFYQNQWYWYDNILVSSEGFDFSGWEYDRSQIVMPFESVDQNGFPIAFDLSSKKGISDHLPLKLVLKYY